MGTQPPVQVPFPWSSFPGANPQEGSGRLINCYSEPLGESDHPTSPAPQVWRRSPGLTQFTTSPQTGYRGGLIVGGLSYETWSGNASTVDVAGTVTSLGAFPGTKKVSIARNNLAITPDVVAVDIDNGAFKLSGGGAPTLYNGGGNLPQPNSVCFQDGYFFFTLGDNRCFASGINALTQNSQTFITVQSKADVTLLRGIAYSGLLWLFTTGSCEIWQDTAALFPAFPYTRLVVIEYGLVQANAIAGWEVGFSELLWVAQDFGVYHNTPGQLAPVKVSPPDLDRLIETQVRSGQTLEAGAYIFAGKKFWTLSSPSWTWEFNLATKRWSERQSLVNGVYGRWRAVGGHPAFGHWVMGDALSGRLIYPDSTEKTELGQPQLFRMESGPVKDFPNQLRIARADFDFDMGVGEVVGNFIMIVTGAANGTAGRVRLSVNSTLRAHTGDICNISGILGTVEANGSFPITVIDDTHFELQGSTFVNVYISGGTAVDVTSPANAQAPTVAISLSKDGGLTWGNPLVRQLGQQGRALRARASVKNMGLSGPMGARWRIDVTDPVYTGFLGATQSNDPRYIGT
jgi:hypothetical protein